MIHQTTFMRATSFWKPKSLDELAAEQGVGPATDLEQISGLWPTDSDPDQLLGHLQRERQAHRSLERDNQGR